MIPLAKRKRFAKASADAVSAVDWHAHNGTGYKTTRHYPATGTSLDAEIELHDRFPPPPPNRVAPWTLLILAAIGASIATFIVAPFIKDILFALFDWVLGR